MGGRDRVFLNERAATLELGRSAIRGLQRGGDRLQMGMVFQIMAGVLVTTRPDAAAIILGAAEAHVIVAARAAQLIGSAVAAALGEEHIRELRARGADMDWDQAAAYTLAQTTQALSEPVRDHIMTFRLGADGASQQTGLRA